jgi:recombinational DNA repair protein (RecF pathway)
VAIIYGGRKKKISLELGNAYHIELSEKRELPSVLNYTPRWLHRYIRYDHKAYAVLSFFIEVINKMATESDDHTSRGSFSNRFKILSNALFYLDDAVKNDRLLIDTHLFLFMTKLLWEEGLLIDLGQCGGCTRETNCGSFCIYRFEKKLQEEYIRGWRPRYADYTDIKASQKLVKSLLAYLIGHLNSDIRSIELL